MTTVRGWRRPRRVRGGSLSTGNSWSLSSGRRRAIWSIPIKFVTPMIMHCRRSLANYKIPRRVEFSDVELPKTESGRILKADCA